MKIKAGKKAFAFVAIASVATTIVAGCGSPSANSANGSASTNKTSSQKAVTLSILWFNNGNEGKVLKKITKQYQQLHPNIHFNIITVPYSNENTKLKTMIAGGQPPALARITDPGEFGSSLLNLSKYLNGTAFYNSFLDAAKPDTTVSGRLVAAPIDVTANGLFYNKTLFAKAGVKVPTSPNNVWTWTQWENAIKTVMKKSGARVGLAYDKSPFRFSTLIYEAGGSIFTKNGKHMAINSTKATQAFTFFNQLNQSGIIPKSIWLGNENPNALFRTGTTAMDFSGNWMIQNYKSLPFKWGATYLPKKAIRSTVPGTDQIAAFKGSGVEKQAVAFLKYFMSPKINAEFCEQAFLLSSLKANGDLKYPGATPTVTDAMKVFENELAATPPTPGRDWANPAMQQFQTPLKQYVIKMLQKKLTPQQTTNALQKIGTKILSQTK
ncbi:sugar ABC transporter substrate-binding protein [Alicyclobacillus sp. SO9]|uniref:ABC transporter substrate-binding protein n=1 Tax=Alicyclobacillus sp. SO9 TaxID=2665646 RepID=UPI0018E6F405|nr:sugar ABC transporter substrate-binding protein [Alicyclobacillus sp. SO9]QQE80242.1 sugar ABC transporter substrate-binding protein [Alicyclobacillus sp. SO9]